MALVIKEECVLCTVFESECPNGAISRGDDAYMIDSTLCTECAGFYDQPQCAAVCPVDCISTPADAKPQDGIYQKFLRLVS
jgi:ferredoxin